MADEEDGLGLHDRPRARADGEGEGAGRGGRIEQCPDDELVGVVCRFHEPERAEGWEFLRPIGGYVDGKYISEGFLREVAARGSEPARYAFQDARVVFSRSASLGPLLAQIPRYPVEDKAARIRRFQGQVEAWLWYCGEALKRQNLPLLRTAVAKLTLFGGRLVLAHNEMLYPYLKWFLRVLATAPEQPPGLVARIEELAAEPNRERIDSFGKLIKEFKGWEMTAWGAQFLQDSELSWFYSSAPVDDI